MGKTAAAPKARSTPSPERTSDLRDGPGRRRWLWLTTTFLAGAIVMALEMVAFRLYAPYFGYSTYVWGTMISIVMVALALGYALGGRLADRSDSDRPLYLFILASAAYQVVLILVVHPLLAKLCQQGEVAGTVLATLIIFAPPMILLASVGPTVVRLLARVGHVGSTAGKVSALSTFGSVAGILLTSFLLVPELGTVMTLKLVCGTTVVLGVAGLVRRHKVALAGLLLIAPLPAGGQFITNEGTIEIVESAYNLIRVNQRGSRLVLILNEENTVQTVRNVEGDWTQSYYDFFALGPYLTKPDRLLVLGMGAGTSVMMTRSTAPEIQVDAVEIDPEIVNMAVKYFDLDPYDPKLTVHIDDARPWLARNQDRFDIIHVDIYQGGPYVPFYLVTEEFFRLVHEHLNDHGLMMMNVLDGSADRYVLATVQKTIEQVFPTVRFVHVGRGNFMTFAFATERSMETVREQLAAVQEDGNEDLVDFAYGIAASIEKGETPKGGIVLTDDHAPLEPLTRKMMQELKVRSDHYESLRPPPAENQDSGTRPATSQGRTGDTTRADRVS